MVRDVALDHFFSRKIFLSVGFLGESHEMVDVMIVVYAKLHGSMFLYLSVKSMCVFRPRHANYMVK